MPGCWPGRQARNCGNPMPLATAVIEPCWAPAPHRGRAPIRARPINPDSAWRHRVCLPGELRATAVSRFFRWCCAAAPAGRFTHSAGSLAAMENLVCALLFPVLLFHSIVKKPLDVRAASTLMLAGVLLGQHLAGAVDSAAPGIGGIRPARACRRRRWRSLRIPSWGVLAGRHTGETGLCGDRGFSSACACRCSAWARSGRWRHGGNGFGRELPQSVDHWHRRRTGLRCSRPVDSGWLGHGHAHRRVLSATGPDSPGAGVRLVGPEVPAKLLAALLLLIKHLLVPLMAFGLAHVMGLGRAGH